MSERYVGVNLSTAPKELTRWANKADHGITRYGFRLAAVQEEVENGTTVREADYWLEEALPSTDPRYAYKVTFTAGNQFFITWVAGMVEPPTKAGQEPTFVGYESIGEAFDITRMQPIAQKLERWIRWEEIIDPQMQFTGHELFGSVTYD